MAFFVLPLRKNPCLCHLLIQNSRLLIQNVDWAFCICNRMTSMYIRSVMNVEHKNIKIYHNLSQSYWDIEGSRKTQNTLLREYKARK